MNASTKFYDFWHNHINYIMQKMRWCKFMSLCQLLFARGRFKHEYLHYSSFTFSYFLHWNNAFFFAFITKIL